MCKIWEQVKRQWKKVDPTHYIHQQDKLQDRRCTANMTRRKQVHYSRVVIPDDPKLMKIFSKSSWGYQAGAREQRTLYIAISQDVWGTKRYNHFWFKHSRSMQNTTVYRGVRDGAIWRLAYSIDNQSEMEEVVTSIQGILCKADLPPFNDKIA